MKELEIARIKKSQAVIAKIAVDAKKEKLSYGQLQAKRYEALQKVERLKERHIGSDEEPKPKKHGGGRRRMEKPEGWEECAKLLLEKVITQKEAAQIMQVSCPTVKIWFQEYVSNSESCCK